MSNSNNVYNINDEINWPYVIKKEARGIDDADFGEVQEIVLHYILTEKGIISKEKFYLPTGLVEGFDGDKLRFNISEDEANRKFKRDNAPSAEEYAIHSRNQTSKTADIGKQQNNKKIASSQESAISTSNEDEDIGQDKSKTQSAEDLSSQNKTSIIKKEIEEKIIREAEDKAKMEAERKAQSIQDKAKMEAERKAQSISQQAEDKSKQDAERRTVEIIQQAEDKARAEAERRTVEIIQQAEDKARAEAERRTVEIIQQAEEKIILNQANTKKTMDYDPRKEKITIDNIGYNDNNSIFNPFEIGLTMWQNYYLFFLNLTKEITKNITKISKDIENTIQET